jgi:peptidoglycan/xylan/chitin deacetylase (PgdA/CDA1 family)
MSTSTRYLIFSVDTEPDGLLWQGFGREKPTFANAAAMPRLLDLLAPYRARATFLVTHSMAGHAPLSRTLGDAQRAGLCEVGMHFHPGDTPPFQGTQAELRDNAALLEDALLAEKLQHHYDLLRETFGRPTSYRAGAWTLDRRVLRFLEAHDFAVDSSVTPGVS